MAALQDDVLLPLGRGRFPGPRVTAFRAWPVPWASSGLRDGVAGLLATVWPPFLRDRSPGPRVAVVGAWPVPLALCGCRGGVAGLLGP